MTPAARPPRKDNAKPGQPRPKASPEQLIARRRTAAVTTLIVGILGIVLVTWGAVSGVNAALDGSGNGADFYVLMFVFGALLIIGTVVAAILGLMGRTGNRIIWVSALVVGLLPIAAVVVVNLRS